VGGLEPLVGMIARADRTAERVVLESLEERDPNLAEAVRAQMFLFEDIIYLDNRAIQQVLREVTPIDLATSLKGVAPEVRDKITGNLSTRAAENLLDELEILGRVRISVVEEAQAKIVAIIRRMEDKGEIDVQRGGSSDEFVV
jgi:flagellar motor switch protein FliG